MRSVEAWVGARGVERVLRQCPFVLFVVVAEFSANLSVAAQAPDDALSGALRLKEERRLEESIQRLETLSRSPGGAGPEEKKSAGPGADEKVGEAPPGAAQILAELEAIDARLRLGRRDGLQARIDRLRHDFPRHRELLARARALEFILVMKNGPLLEPNAIARADLGSRFFERFLSTRGGSRRATVPLDRPIRFLCDLNLATERRTGRTEKIHPVVLLGFVGRDDLQGARLQALQRAFDHFERDPRALLCLFVFAGEGELPAVQTAEGPLSRAAVFWIRGTPAALADAPVRTRYEWLAGPTFFLMEPGGLFKSWRWPHEGWDGFLVDIQSELDKIPPPKTPKAAPSKKDD